MLSIPLATLLSAVFSLFSPAPLYPLFTSAFQRFFEGDFRGILVLVFCSFCRLFFFLAVCDGGCGGLPVDFFVDF